MFQNTWTRLPNVIILIGQQVSNVVNVYDIFDALTVTVQAPNNLDAATYTIETSVDYEADARGIVKNAGSWATLLNSQTGAAHSVPASSQSKVYFELPNAGSFRIKVSANAVATQTFLASKVVNGGD